MINTFSDSVRERQEEKKNLSPREEKRLRTRNEELENKIEKLSTKHSPAENMSFFDKIRRKGSIEDERAVPNQG